MSITKRVLFACCLIVSLLATGICPVAEAATNYTFPAELGEVNIGLNGLTSTVPFSSVFAAENVQTNEDAAMSFDVVAVKTPGGEWQEVMNTTFTVTREITGREDMTLPEVHVIQKGETLTVIANRYGVTVDQLIQWNRRKVIVGEPIYVSDPLGFDRWVFVGADPSAHTMLEQVDMMPTLPDAVRPIMRQQVATVMPDTVFVPRYLILHDEIEGGLVTKEVKVKELSLALWIDRKTGQPIESLPALAYPPVFYEGKAYTLVRFLDCGNGSYLCEPYRLEVTSEVTITPLVVAPPETTEVYSTPPVVYRPLRHPQRAHLLGFAEASHLADLGNVTADEARAGLRFNYLLARGLTLQTDAYVAARSVPVDNGESHEGQGPLFGINPKLLWNAPSMQLWQSPAAFSAGIGYNYVVDGDGWDTRGLWTAMILQSERYGTEASYSSIDTDGRFLDDDERFPRYASDYQELRWRLWRSFAIDSFTFQFGPEFKWAKFESILWRNSLQPDPGGVFARAMIKNLFWLDTSLRRDFLDGNDGIKRYRDDRWHWQVIIGRDFPIF